MSQILQIGEQNITEKDLFPLLAENQMLMPLAREIFLSQAIAKTECTAQEIETARKQFFNQYQISSEEHLQVWLQKNYLTKEQLEKRIARGIKIEKFKLETWESKLESYYLKRKNQFDKVVYSLIRIKDASVAQTLYFRIQAGEQTFEEVAKKYSQGAESQTGGLIGPVELNVPHPQISQTLMTSQPGKLLPPTRIGEWVVILRLEKYLAAQLDFQMKQRLLNELFNNWLNEQLQKNVSITDTE